MYLWPLDVGHFPPQPEEPEPSAAFAKAHTASSTNAPPVARIGRQIFAGCLGGTPNQTEMMLVLGETHHVEGLRTNLNVVSGLGQVS